jgi:hypothetical protein
VSLFVLSPEIKERDEVEVDNWAKHKKTVNDIIILLFLSSSRSQKNYSKMTIFTF